VDADGRVVARQPARVAGQHGPAAAARGGYDGAGGGAPDPGVGEQLLDVGGVGGGERVDEELEVGLDQGQHGGLVTRSAMTSARTRVGRRYLSVHCSLNTALDVLSRAWRR
jgi:hypothetical protein